MQVEEIHSKESMDLRNSEKGRSLEMCYTVLVQFCDFCRFLSY